MKKVSKSALHRFFSIQANSVFYRITLAFSLFFLGPLLGFVFLGIKSDLFGSQELLYCLLGVLIVSLGGYVILKQIAQGIMSIEAKLAGNRDPEHQFACRIGENELSNISRMTDAMTSRMQQVSDSLTTRMLEIQGIRDISNLASSCPTPQTLIVLAMEKSMHVTGAIGGAVFLVPAGSEDPPTVSCLYRVGDGFARSAEKPSALLELIGKTVLENEKGTLLQNTDKRWQQIFSPDCALAVAMPFFLDRKQRAVAVLTAGSGVTWDDGVTGFLATFFNTVSSWLKIQELGMKEQETSDELRAILSILKAISSDSGEPDLLAAIANTLFELFPCHWLGLALLDPVTGELRLAQTIHRKTSGMQKAVVLERNSSLFQRAIDSLERLDCDDLDAESFYYERELFQDLGIRSCMIHSLHRNERIIGAICLGYDKSRAFGIREKRLFSILVSGIAIALEQSRLLSRQRRKSTELEILNRIGVALTSSAFDIKRVLHYILEMVVKLINVEAGAVMLLNQDVLTFQAMTGIVGKNLEGMQVNLGQGICGWVAATGESVVIHDVKENPHFFADIDGTTGFVTRNIMCAPMISNGHVIGVFQLINKVGRFNEDDQRTLKAVSSSAAVAFENNRLYSESARLAEKERLIRTIFQKYVPEEIVNTILEKGEQEHIAVGERKIVTVFNIDIRGYSEMSKRAATEEVVEVLNYFFMRMGNIILRHRGMVDKYLGDGFLAIFGAPVATRNPALDATYAAIEMVKAIDEVSRLAVERCGVPLKIGISLNTGEAIVGNIGFDRKMEYTAIGDVVNETFRLQELTRERSGLILIGEATYQQVKSFVLAHPWGLREVDGKGGKMQVYEVMARKEISDIENLGALTEIELSSEKIH
jgi:class 3 adenylate cyclase/putative methionine-R-sulfoxide reductase with GAF domain